MSTVTTTTEEQQQQQGSPRKGDSSSSNVDPMFDSGFCGSLRLSLQGSLTASTGSTSNPAAGPAPVEEKEGSGGDGAAAAEREQEKCREMMRRMNIGEAGAGAEGLSGSSTETSEGAAATGASGPASELSADSWREYFEPDEDGDVQLHLAIASGFVDVIFALVRMAPHPDYLGIRNRAAYAPLHIAVLQDQPEVVRRLVVAGAALDVRDAEGNTPLHLAARRGNTECAEALLRPVRAEEMREARLAAPALLTRLPADVVDLRNHAGEHCVHLAAMGGHVHFLRFLCWSGADVNAADGRAGRTALHFAVGAGDVAAATALAEPRPRGCGADAAQPDWYGRTPCQLALLNGAPVALADFLARVMTGDASASAVALFPAEAAAASLAASSSDGGSDTEKNSALLLNSSA